MLDFFIPKPKPNSSPQRTFTAKPKPTLYVNNPHLGDTNRVIYAVIRVCFGLSTISGSFCLGGLFHSIIATWLPSMIGAENLEGFISAAAYFVAYGAGFFICSLVDFYGINTFAKYTAFEIALLISGSSRFNMWRKISLMFWSVVSASFIAASFALSWYGAAILTAINSKTDSKIIEMVQSTTKAVDASAYSLELQQLKAIEARRDVEVKAIGNSELRKLAKDGNSWAVSELTDAENRIKAKFEKQIAVATENLRKAKEAAENKQSKANDMLISISQSEIQGAKTKSQAIGLISVLFGVAPLIIAVILLIIAEMSNVVEEVIQQRKMADKEKMANAMGK